MKWVAPVGSTVLLDAVTSYVAIVVSTKSHSLFRLLGPEPFPNALIWGFSVLRLLRPWP